MCDLFALAKAKKNMDGWGIGYFRKHHAFIEKSAKRVFVSGYVHDSFRKLARVVKSRIIICHIESYKSHNTILEEAVSDSARAFEYLRDHLLRHYRNVTELPTLFQALCQSTERMVEEYPGEYNYLLSNGRSLFVFTNHRQFMFLKGSKKLEGALLLTTLERGLSDEKWIRIARATNRKGTLLAVSGTDIILKQSL